MNSKVHPFWPQNEWRNFGRDESLTSWRKTKNLQIKLITKFNNNEQQDARNNTEL